MQNKTLVRVGMGQMLVEGGKPENNLARAQEMVTEAGRKSCDIVVLPECLDLGWTDPSAATMAEPIPGPRSDLLAQGAADAGIAVAAGLTEQDGQVVYNAAVLIDAEGSIRLKHRKINELDIAHSLYSCGRSLGVGETHFGLVGVNICADNFPDCLSLGDALARMGAAIIASPSAWAVDADHDNQSNPYGDLWIGSYSEIARKFRIPVVGVSNVGWITGGPWKGKKCIGASVAVDAEGNVAARGTYGESAEGLTVVDIALPRDYGWGTKISEYLAR